MGVNGFAILHVDDWDHTKGSRGLKILVHEWVTGGGLAGSELPANLASQGHAMRQAVASDFRAVKGVEVFETLDERFVDRVDAAEKAVVFVSTGGEEATLRTLAEACDHTVLIAPETGGLLAHRAWLVAGVGGSSLGSTAEAIAVAGDKLALADHLRARRISTPPTHRLMTGDCNYRGPFPAVVKPIDGVGSDETYFVATKEALVDVPASESARIIQPLRPGEPMSASFLIGTDGTVHLLAVGLVGCCDPRWSVLLRRWASASSPGTSKGATAGRGLFGRQPSWIRRCRFPLGPHNRNR